MVAHPRFDFLGVSHMYLNKKQTAQLVGKSTRTVDRWVELGLIKKYKVEGSHPVFKKEEVIELMEGSIVAEQDITWIW